VSKGVFRRKGYTLVPAGDTALDAVGAVKDGDLCFVSVRAARNPEQHNLWFALCSLVANSTDDTLHNVRKWVLHKLNYVDIWVDPVTGVAHVEAQSVAFESMPQADFNAMFQASLNVLSERMETTPQALRDRFEELQRGRAP